MSDACINGSCRSVCIMSPGSTDASSIFGYAKTDRCKLDYRCEDSRDETVPDELEAPFERAIAPEQKRDRTEYASIQKP